MYQATSVFMDVHCEMMVFIMTASLFWLNCFWLNPKLQQPKTLWAKVHAQLARKRKDAAFTSVVVSFQDSQFSPDMSPACMDLHAIHDKDNDNDICNN